VEDIKDSFRANKVKKKSKNQKKIKKFHFWSIFADFCQFLPILCIKNHVLKKVGRGRSGDRTYFQLESFKGSF
jgi:hypothetical protein